MPNFGKVEFLISNFTDNAIKDCLKFLMDEIKGNKYLIASLTARKEQQSEKIVEMTKENVLLKERLSAQERHTSKDCVIFDNLSLYLYQYSLTDNVLLFLKSS